jgi:hypothetical protein
LSSTIDPNGSDDVREEGENNGVAIFSIGDLFVASAFRATGGAGAK